MATETSWDDLVRRMPKVELHLHLEGAFTLETLHRLINKYGGDPTVRTVDDLRARFWYKNFDHFIQTWYWKNQFFREGEDFELATYETLMRLREQNIVYLEAFYSPWDFLLNGISMDEITKSVIAGCEKAARSSGISWNLIADINRECGRKAGIERLGQICEFQHRGVIGIGLGGDERRYPPELYEDVFQEAARRGLHRTVHAGEAAGANSIWTALNRLGAQRIGHGVRASEDAKLVETLRERSVPLEMCVTSNIKTGVVASVREHPIKSYLEKGLNVSVNTDDPTMFGCTITDEYLLLFDELEFTPSDIKKVSMNAVDSSFLELKSKQQLRNQFESWWNSIDLVST